jgi:hypothetical protein
MRCERGYRGRHMAEGNKRRGQEMRYNGHTFSGRLTWKGVEHVAGGEWMMIWTKRVEMGGHMETGEKGPR